jgi:hypothetical protein
MGIHGSLLCLESHIFSVPRSVCARSVQLHSDLEFRKRTFQGLDEWLHSLTVSCRKALNHPELYPEQVQLRQCQLARQVFTVCDFARLSDWLEETFRRSFFVLELHEASDEMSPGRYTVDSPSILESLTVSGQKFTNFWNCFPILNSWRLLFGSSSKSSHFLLNILIQFNGIKPQFHEKFQAFRVFLQPFLLFEINVYVLVSLW